jgi:3-hydroxybutyrate dehydrogenase
VLTLPVQKQIDTLAEREDMSHDDTRLKLLSEKQPAREFVRVEQIGDLVVYLCSESASSMTGMTLSIDGGWAVQ